MAERDFEMIFGHLKELLAPFEEGLLLKTDTAAEYTLDAPASETWARGLFFGSVKMGKGYVSFHLMPVYMFPDLLDDLSDGLKKRMQGKSCFNFKKIDADMLNELRTLTRCGFERFQAERLL